MALNAYVNIVVIKVYITTAFNIRCPNPLERYVRSKALCTDAQNYTCLFDENLMSYSESCYVKFDFQRPGYRVTLRTNRHAEVCQDDLYQPVIFFTNESSNCVFEKSLCRKEGQLVSSNGTIKTDRQCRCNYADGYTFVVEPKDVCACVPSEEDCSCYRKQCSENQIISKDYQCIDNFTSADNFTCSSIYDEAVVPELQVPNVTVSSYNSGTSHIQKIKRHEKMIILLCLILFGILLLMICSSIIICVENISADTKIQDNTKHGEFDIKINSFMQNNVIQKAMDKLAATNCVLFWGNPGCGKTTTLSCITKFYINDLGYQLKSCYKPSDIFKQQLEQCATEKYIFVIDDICGRFVFSYEKFLRLKRREKHIKQLLEDQKVKLLLTCSSVAFKTVPIYALRLFTNTTFELTQPPKHNMQKCSKYTELPPNYIIREVEKLKKSDYKAFCCLFICILKQGCIDVADLTSEDDNILNKIKRKVCSELNIDISRHEFRDNLFSLINTTLIDNENVRLFSISQTSVFEVLAVYFGHALQRLLIQYAEPDLITQHCCLKSCPDFEGNGMFRIHVNEENEELYFRRIKEQLLRRNLSEVFSIQQMDSTLYRKRFAVFLQDLEPDVLGKISNSTCRLQSETALSLTKTYVILFKILYDAKIHYLKSIQF